MMSVRVRDNMEERTTEENTTNNSLTEESVEEADAGAQAGTQTSEEAAPATDAPAEGARSLLANLDPKQKAHLAWAAVALVLIACFAFLAFGEKKPSTDYTGLWKAHANEWVYVEKGEKAEDYTGAVTGVVDKTEGTFYVKNGDVDLTYTGLGTSEEGWVYFTKGVLDDTFSGFATAGDTWYWVKDGAVDQTFTGAKSGTVAGETTWWYVDDGAIDFTYRGAVKTPKGVWFFNKGKLDTSYSGVRKQGDHWYYFSEGKQNKDYTGVAANENDFGYTGKVKFLGRNYKVENGLVGNGKAVYLTFDDGPGAYTDELLKILDKHHVKATFFVTGNYKSYYDCLAKEAKAGHSIGVHSFTHNYGKIYKSEKAYWADFEQMEDLIEQQTGERTILFRFPGGSSNLVSKKYNEGIMTELVKEANQKGLVFFDWNVLSGDAGDTTDSEKIYKNIVNGCAQHTQSVVLCHDIHDFTVGAMDKTISKLLKQGYVFMPLDQNSPTAHQPVNN